MTAERERNDRHTRNRRSKMAQPRSTTNKDFEQYKNSFLNSPYVRAADMMTIRDISQTENQYLYPFFLAFKNQINTYTSGVFILDARAIYTPIEAGYYGVVHVERLPVVKPPVYGLTDLTDCAIMYDVSWPGQCAGGPPTGDRTIIFQGVFSTPYGYKFIHEDFHIKPITGLSFASPRMMVAVDETTTQRAAPKDDDEEDFVS